MRFIALTVVFICASAASASAQSFDCAKARLATEYAICDSPRLSRLDERMSALYFGLPYVVREEIEGSQRRWLRRRNTCRYDRGCIARAYRRRIEVLSAF